MVLSIFIKILMVWLIIKINIIIMGLVIILFGFMFIVKLLNMLVRIFFDNFRVNKWMYDRMLFNRFVVML